MSARRAGVFVFVLVAVLVPAAATADHAVATAAPPAGAVTAPAPESATSRPATPSAIVDPAAAARFAALALECVHKEYPNKVSHVLASDADARPPRELHPVFYGCYDWHSAVHGHWLLIRLARHGLDFESGLKARNAVAASLSPIRVETEVKYLRASGRASFERPYGLAWLLQLHLELHEMVSDPPPPEERGEPASVQARRLATLLEPLVGAARERLADWLPKLAYPIRIGEHDQTAFAFGLVLDWARGSGDAEMAALVETTTLRLYAADRSCPLAYEPSGQDFLSPCLAEADLLRRVMPPRQFAEWLTAFLPQLPRDGSAAWLPVGIVTDRADPKLAHLDGLNLSRAWMLEGIAAGLPADDARRAALLAAAGTHRDAALPHVTGERYEGGHWLGSFATYLVTQRGVRAAVNGR